MLFVIRLAVWYSRKDIPITEQQGSEITRTFAAIVSCATWILVIVSSATWGLAATPVEDRFTQRCLATSKPNADTIGDCSKAIERLKKSNKPDLAAEALAVRSVAHELGGNPERAADDINEAIRFAKSEHGPLLKRSFVDYEIGNFQRAIATLTHLAAKFPEDAAIHRELSYNYVKLHNLKKALAYCEQALKIEPRNADYQNNAAWVLLLMDRLDEGLWYAEKAISINPGFRPAHDTRANILSSLGRADEAVEEFAKSLYLGGEADFKRMAGLLRKKKYLDAHAMSPNRKAIIAALKKCVAERCRLAAELD